MLTDSSLALITFINLFLVPMISLRIFSKRNHVEWKLNLNLIYRYALFCIFNLPFTRVFCVLAEKIFKIVCLPDSAKYTLIAVVSAAVLPFLFEIIEHYINIDVIITYPKGKNTTDKKEQNQ